MSHLIGIYVFCLSTIFGSGPLSVICIYLHNLHVGLPDGLGDAGGSVVL